MDKTLGFRAFMVLLVVIILAMLITMYRTNKSHVAAAPARQVAHERFNASMQPSDGFTTEAYAPVDDMPVMGSMPATNVCSPAPQGSSGLPGASGAGAVLPSEPLSNEQYRAVDFAAGGGSDAPASAYPSKRLSAEDLLPKDAANTKWAQVTPLGQGELRDLNFVTAGWHIGVNTQGQSLRNANLQLHSDPINPQFKVSPWNMSTVEPDVSRRPFEIS
ncbi:hypothetical protein HYH03_017284 [Edaphochlamys debaryana]|uniref:Minor capsid protein P11 C-terminal conserved region domain-containing protein n=1 Tax=Edaphochlamys debaryana TaxID=47281 RepID=A0A835XMX3_9CHLO|nr:hypothetical protein HYH03_017284 [Edaphochlamys debaryana]|eukprot:KAG2483890.1 hypothetical protein HYH03_017284 [Edaphochlamys debaryana]